LDGHLAALMRRHGVTTIYTRDRVHREGADGGGKIRAAVPASQIQTRRRDVHPPA
jgi:hypothetical protein